MDGAAVQVEAALSELFRLSGSERLHRQRLTEARLDPSLSLTGLRLLRAVDGGRAHAVSDLARLLHLTVPTASRQLLHLEEQGLLRRTADPADARRARYAATRSGRAAVRRFAAATRHPIATSLARWEPTDAQQLADLLARMVADLRAGAATVGGVPA